MENNLEFALAVAGSSIGLAALLIFSLVTIANTWRTFSSAAGASREAQTSLLMLQDLVRNLPQPSQRAAETGGPAVPEAPGLSQSELEAVVTGFAELRHQADDLIERQVRLQEAVRNLVESRALVGAESSDMLRDLETTMGQMAAAVANLTQRVDRMTG